MVEIPVVDGYEWQLLTQTYRYDSAVGSEDMAWRGLRRRVLLAIRVAGVQWRTQLRGPGRAMYRVVEVSPKGAVHTHMIYYGPLVDVDALGKIAKGVSKERGGYALKKRIGPKEFQPGDEAQSIALKRAMRAVAIYGLKGLKSGGAHHPHRNEDWLAGQRILDGIDSVLAARWEAATFGLKLSQPYGKLMGMAPAEDDDSMYSYQEPDDHDVACEECGTIGQWTTRSRNADGWFTYCHFKKGSAAMEGGRWTPPWMRRRKKRWRAPVVRDF